MTLNSDKLPLAIWISRFLTISFVINRGSLSKVWEKPGVQEGQYHRSLEVDQDRHTLAWMG